MELTIGKRWRAGVCRVTLEQCLEQVVMRMPITCRVGEEEGEDGFGGGGNL